MMRAQNLIDHQYYYFVEKCVPFGASVSCALFQKFLDALHFIIEFKTKRNRVTNYLDDFLFISWIKSLCNQYVSKFIEICQDINVPISEEKTEWAEEIMVFLGLLMDGRRHLLSILDQKLVKVINTIEQIITKKKATVKELQSLVGLLNFLNHAIMPG